MLTLFRYKSELLSLEQNKDAPILTKDIVEKFTGGFRVALVFAVKTDVLI